MISVYIRRVGIKRRVNLRLIRELVSYILEQEGKGGSSLSIKICDHKTIHRMNRLYLDHDWPTDVLAFPMIEDGSEDFSDVEESYIGDCVVSMEMAFERCKEFDHSPDEELALYIIHAVLHILGYTDKETECRKIMRARESKYMRKFQEKILHDKLIYGDSKSCLL
ncbi:rRNA maturation RNase YbeY [PVC group bacterium (ex Bugula neritina AB1)]|nr:rRNA maturation RNase YbeY [PVC group bacterium (ex Bugula neritina AB1)]